VRTIVSDIELLRAIAAHMEETGVPPTYRELAERVGIRHVSVAFYGVGRLIDRGWVRMAWFARSRAIRITDAGRMALEQVTPAEVTA
jgi:SOS-response transcriptional repressor LexA